MDKILIFGDSIAQGYWDDEFGGWAERLKIFCMKNDEDVTVHNHGYSGDTSEELLKRLEFERKNGRLEDKDVAIIFAIGMNDSGFIHSEDSLQVNQEKFKKNIDKIIQSVKKLQIKYFFVGINNVIDSITDPVPWHLDISYKNENIKKYNKIIKLICEENNINFIDIFNLLNRSDFYNDDGVHPNPKGHQKIFEIVKESLIKNKII